MRNKVLLLLLTREFRMKLTILTDNIGAFGNIIAQKYFAAMTRLRHPSAESEAASPCDNKLIMPP